MVPFTTMPPRAPGTTPPYRGAKTSGNGRASGGATHRRSNKIVGWTALMGPPGLPKEVVERWTEVFAKLATDPDWQQGNARIGGVAAIRSPAESDQFLREQ